MYQIGQFRRTQLPIDRYKITKQGEIVSVKATLKVVMGKKMTLLFLKTKDFY